jgi:hypothetical protein
MRKAPLGEKATTAMQDGESLHEKQEILGERSPATQVNTNDQARQRVV